MNNKDRIEIRVSGPSKDHELGIFLPWDANIDDWISAFKTILIHQTFPEDTIKELFEEKVYEGDKEREDPEQPLLFDLTNKPDFAHLFGNVSTVLKQKSTYSNAY